jgi:dTDP-4-dehydrorhamnose reductase
MNTNITGLVHLTNNQVITKYNLLCLFKKYFIKNDIEIIASESLVSDKSIICTRQDIGYEVPSYDVMVEEMQNWIDDNRKLYKVNQYN